MSPTASSTTSTPSSSTTTAPCELCGETHRPGIQNGKPVDVPLQFFVWVDRAVGNTWHVCRACLVKRGHLPKQQRTPAPKSYAYTPTNRRTATKNGYRSLAYATWLDQQRDLARERAHDPRTADPRPTSDTPPPRALAPVVLRARRGPELWAIEAHLAKPTRTATVIEVDFNGAPVSTGEAA